MNKCVFDTLLPVKRGSVSTLNIRFLYESINSPFMQLIQPPIASSIASSAMLDVETELQFITGFRTSGTVARKAQPDVRSHVLSGVLLVILFSLHAVAPTTKGTRPNHRDSESSQRQASTILS